MRKETIIGVALLIVMLLMNYFLELPNFLMGMLLGGAIGFQVIGILPEETYKKFRDKKWGTKL